jgi:L-histidine N-alpha-methyltransferase
MANPAAFSPEGKGRASDLRRAKILADVRRGLFRTPRELSSKYFYDERGSRLFEQITELPEYYPTRAEREILEAHAGEIVERSGARTLVELGAGSAAKTRILLDALTKQGRDAAYVPVDVSGEFLAETARRLSREYPRLRIAPVVADIETDMILPATIAGPLLFAFLGSTIGNFHGGEAVALLRRLRARMRAEDRFLLGTDLRKSPDVLHAAYNDSAGVTAEFNRNLLRVLDAELGADFVPEYFAHRAFYDERSCRVEMHLVAIGDQVVHIPGLPTIVLRDGESIRTEVSYKYDRRAVEALARAAGLRIAEWYVDDDNRFAVSLLAPA